MKTFRLFLLALLLPAFVMVGCDTGDKTPDDPENSGGLGVPSEDSRLVSQITVIALDGEPYNQTIDFTYDNLGRSTGWVADGEELNIVYSDNNVTINSVTVDPDDETKHYEDIYTFVCDDNGNAIAGNWDSSNTEGYEDSGSWTATYDGSGYLKKINSSRQYGPEDISNYTYDFTWTAGNLSKIVNASENDDDPYIVTIEYGNVVNNPKCNIDLGWFAFPEYFSVNSAFSPYGLMFGLYGKRSAKMPVKVTQDDWITNVTYETDSEGFVTKIKTEWLEYSIAYR